VRAHKGPQFTTLPMRSWDISVGSVGVRVVRLVGVGYPFRGGQAHK